MIKETIIASLLNISHDVTRVNDGGTFGQIYQK